jgi:hypothetical protein
MLKGKVGDKAKVINLCEGEENNPRGRVPGAIVEIVQLNSDNSQDEHYTVRNKGGFLWWYREDELEILGKEGVTTANSALDKQISGNHYKGCKIQPVEYIQANELDYLQGNVIKYVTRHKLKNGKADIEKAIHYLELILELQYGE